MYTASSMVVSGVSAFAILGMKTKLHNILLSSVFSCISVIGWNALDVLNPELFPTELRSFELRLIFLDLIQPFSLGLVHQVSLVLLVE